MEPENSEVLFMKYAEGFGLPSVSPGCIQVEAYLRLAKLAYVTQVMRTSGTSPTGCLPAVETKEGLAGHAHHTHDDMDAAASAMSLLQQSTDIDAAVPSAIAAESAAFNSLVEAKLSSAVRYSMWCEWQSLSQLTMLYGNSLPWPLNYVIPYSQSLRMRGLFKGQDPAEIYKDAQGVIKAVESRLVASGGPYLLGEQPTSLDAKLYGLLAYISVFGTIAPVLKDALHNAPSLQQFVQYISSEHFSTPAPAFAAVEFGGNWSSAANGATEGAGRSSSDEDRTLSRRSWMWLGGFGAVMVGYVLFGGQYIDFSYDDEEEDEV